MLVTRISSKSKMWSIIATLYQDVPRAPMWPSTFESLRARCFAPSAVTAPVRIQVIAVELTMAYGAPVSGRMSSRVESSDGRLCSWFRLKSPSTLTPTERIGPT